MTDTLFELSYDERVMRLRRFITDEIDQRERMLERHPERMEYWQARIAQAQVALDDLEHI